MDWVHQTAMACDDNNPLPEHLSNEDEIEELEKLFEFIIKSTFDKNNEFLITIARLFTIIFIIMLVIFLF